MVWCIVHFGYLMNVMELLFNGSDGELLGTCLDII